MKIIDAASAKSPGRPGDGKSASRTSGGGHPPSGAKPVVLRTALAFAALASWGLVFVMVWQL